MPACGGEGERMRGEREREEGEEGRRMGVSLLLAKSF